MAAERRHNSMPTMEGTVVAIVTAHALKVTTHNRPVAMVRSSSNGTETTGAFVIPPGSLQVGDKVTIKHNQERGKDPNMPYTLIPISQHD